MIELFEHNKTAYLSVLEQLAETGRACVIHPTGTGKSFIAFKWIEDNPNGRFVWLSPSANIFNTQLENVKRVSGFEPRNILFLTYQRLMMMTDEEMERLQPTHIVLDEFHRAGAARWNQNINALLSRFSGAQVLGLTATPVRYLDNQRDMADELFDNCIADSMTLGEAIARGILPAPKYVVSLYSFEGEMEKYRSRMQRVGAAARKRAQEYLEQLRRALERAEGLNRVFARHMPNGRGKYIAFCANREHMREMLAKATEWFGDIDAAPHIYSVWSDSPSAEEDYAEFIRDDSDHLKLLYCIDMFNEGIHVEDIDGVILFRPTISPIIYKQQIGRALSAMKGGVPVIFDVVNNFESLYSISSVQEEMREFISFYRNHHREDGTIPEGFQVVDEVRECRRLFEALEETLDLSWELMYREARRYYETNGDLNVPKLYRTEENIPLGAWIQTQRQVRNGGSGGMLSPQRIALLDEIGMIWKSRETLAWEKGLAHAKAYAEAHGNLEAPSRYICEDGYRLGDWIDNLKTARNRRGETGVSAIWEARYRELEALGMRWDRTKPSDEAFEKGYAEAAVYAKAHGTLDMARGYVTDSGYKLGSWIQSVRMRHEGHGWGAPLTEAQIRRLEAIGMEWQGKRERRWEACYAEAERYYLAHGNLEIQGEYEVHGVSLTKWLSRQAASYREGKLDPERTARLEAIGMAWPGEASAWEENYEHAREYYLAHGDLEIPPKYVAPNGAWLGKWLSLQRKARERNALTQAQITRLDAIGMRWDTMKNVRWQEAYEALRDYVDGGTALDAIPRDAQTRRGTNLHQWIKCQKQRERSGKLSATQQQLWHRLTYANQR